MVSAGRVLIMPKGAWNSTDTYSMLDLVSYNGSSYVAKTSVPANTLPTNTSYWQLSAYGGSASNVDGNFALTETTDYASRNYTVGDFLVTKDSVFCKVKAPITTGDQLVMDTNIEATSVAALYDAAIDYADELDAKSVKLQGQTAITTQTDLNDLTTVGNYYKSSTSVYVTNAPTGIASELTAIFRLTVENGSDTTDKILQTLVTNDGKTYKRGYNGSTWSTWAELASVAAVSTVRDAVTDVEETIAPVEASTTAAAAHSIGDQFYQGDVLYEAIAPIDIGDTLIVGTNVKVADTVTEQIASVKSDLSNDETAIFNILGSKNLARNDHSRIIETINGLSFDNTRADGSILVDGINSDNKATAATSYMLVNQKAFLPVGDYILSGAANDTGMGLYINKYLNGSNVGTVVGASSEGDVPFSITYDGYDSISLLMYCGSGAVVDNKVFKPMIRPATVKNSTYVPYAKTNKEITDELKSINSDITDINSDIYNIKHKSNIVADAEFTATSTNTWEYTGVSFTLTKTTLVSVQESYTNAGTLGLAVGTTDSNINSANGAVETSFGSAKRLVIMLYAGTYYIWSKNSQTGKNYISVIKLMEYDN